MGRRRRGIKSDVAERQSVIENVGGEVPFGICALETCTGESARSVIVFRPWHLDLHHRVAGFFAQPVCFAICRGCFERKAN